MFSTNSLTCALLASAAALAAFDATTARADCVSGNTGDIGNGIYLLSEANCQANGSTIGGSTAVGQGATATGQNTVAMGKDASATALGATAIGNSAGTFAGAEGLTAVGYGAGLSSAPYGVALGVRAVAGGTSSVAIGGADNNTDRAEVLSNYGVAIGFQTSASGIASIALGQAANTTDDSNIAIGTISTAQGINSTAIGRSSLTSGSNSITIGTTSKAMQNDAVAIGRRSAAEGLNSVAVGALAKTTTTDSVAIGPGARVIAANAAAIGNDSLANIANSVSVGKIGAERRIMNVANAVAQTDAVNLRQVKQLIAAAQPHRSSAEIGYDGAIVTTAAFAPGAGWATGTSVREDELSKAEPKTACADAGIAGNWSVIATNIEDVGAGSVLWCEAEFGTTSVAGKYSVSGVCVGHTPNGGDEHYEIAGDQSVTVTQACRISGGFAIRQSGAAELNVSILSGRIEGSGEVKTRGVVVSRWPRGGKFALQTMVMQR